MEAPDADSARTATAEDIQEPPVAAEDDQASKSEEQDAINDDENHK